MDSLAAIAKWRVGTVRLFARLDESAANRLIYCVLLAIVLVVYWPTTRSDFVSYDDPFFVTENDYVKAGLTYKGLRHAITSLDGLYQPVTHLSFMLDAQLFGLNPAAFHMTNLWLHAFNTLLLFSVFRKYVRAPFALALGAVAFAVHPINVESVAWISERKGLLAAFFSLLATMYYCRYLDTRRFADGAWSTIMFSLALLSKVSAVTLPLVALAVAYCDQRAKHRSRTRICSLADAWTLCGPVVGLSLILCVVVGALNLVAELRVAALKSLADYPVALRIALCGYVPIFQLSHFLGPRGLFPFYEQSIWGTASLLLCFVSAFAGGAIFLYRRQRDLSTIICAVTAFTLLLPSLGIAPVGEHFAADRYMYLPSAALCMGAAVWFGSTLFRMKPDLPVIGSLSLLICLVILNQRQQRTWVSSNELYRHALSVNPNIAKAYNNLGAILLNEGKVRPAIELFRRATEEKWPYFEAQYNMGLSFLRLHQYARALIWLKEAENANPFDSTLLAFLGHACLRLRHLPEGIRYYERSLERNRNHLKSLPDLALVYAASPEKQARDPERALMLAKHSCRITQNVEFTSLTALAMAYAAKGDFTNALAQVQRAKSSASVLDQTRALGFLGGLSAAYASHRLIETNYVDW